MKLNSLAEISISKPNKEQLDIIIEYKGKLSHKEQNRTLQQRFTLLYDFNNNKLHKHSKENHRIKDRYHRNTLKYPSVIHNIKVFNLKRSKFSSNDSHS